MLNFMYRFDYDADNSDQDSVSPMIFHVKVYNIADKYDVPMLFTAVVKGLFPDPKESSLF